MAVVDTYTAVFCDDDGQAQLQAMLAKARPDVRPCLHLPPPAAPWPRTAARPSVQGVPVPDELVTRNRQGPSSPS